MKKRCSGSGWMFDLRRFAYFAGAAAALTAALAPNSLANTELDRRYSLDSVGFIRSWDNVDGLFADYVAQAYKDYFSRHTRFSLQDLSKADAVLQKSKIPYNKVIEDPEILSQLARSMRTQSVIRTKIAKEGQQYRFSLTWMHAPQMDVLAKETFILKERADGSGFTLKDIKKALDEALDKLILKVPFYGAVTGRDGESVTVNIGANEKLERDDTLVIGTIEEVKRHPLLKEVVDWRFSQTGKLHVDQVDEGIAFTRVIDEEEARPIARGQKIIQVIKKPPHIAAPVIYEKGHVPEAEFNPTYGWLSGGLMMGGYSRQYGGIGVSGNSAQPTAYEGSGLLFGPKIEGQLWFTRHWFAEAMFGYGGFAYSQTAVGGTDDGQTTFQGVSGGVSTFKIAAGYTYLVDDNLLGTKGWAKVGYRSTSYSLPTDATQYVAPSSFTSLLIGVGAELPIRNIYGAFFNIEFGALPGGKQTGIPGQETGSDSDVVFSLGAYYRYSKRMTFRATVDVSAQNIDFAGGQTLSQKTIGLVPTLIYFF